MPLRAQSCPGPGWLQRLLLLFRNQNIFDLRQTRMVNFATNNKRCEMPTMARTVSWPQATSAVFAIVRMPPNKGGGAL